MLIGAFPRLWAADEASEIFNAAAPAIIAITATKLDGATEAGTGFIVNPDGVVLTAYHVIVGAKEVTVRLRDGRSFPVSTILGIDEFRDVSVLKIEAAQLPSIPLADSAQAKIGQRVFVIGNPQGLEYTITDGLLSGLRDQGFWSALQCSVPVSPGNSGSPLLDISGRAIGIMIRSEPSGQNLNFAVPVNDTKRFLKASSGMTLKEYVERRIPAEHEFENGKQAANVQAGIEAYERAVQLDPSFSEAHLMLCNSYALPDTPSRSVVGDKTVGNLDKAQNMSIGVTHCEQSLRLDQGNVISYIIIANSYSARAVFLDEKGEHADAKNDFAKATEYLNQALGIDPSSPRAYYLLGALQVLTGDPTMARTSYEKVLQIDPRFVGAYVQLGGLFFERGELDRAIALYKQALAIDPTNELAHSGLCRAYIGKGDKNSALAELSKVHDPDAQFNLSFLISMPVESTQKSSK